MWLGVYEIQNEVGRGGAGIVYRARDRAGRDVAIKVLLGPGALAGRAASPQTEQALARFDRERRLLAELGRERGFVPFVDGGESPVGPYLVMPFITGGTLRRRLLEGPLPIEEAASLVTALATALGHAHEKGILHRDLKPENILFDGGTPLISDLGLAKHFRADTPGASQSVQLSRTGEFRGTAGYMAPEQMSDARAVGPAADVFALGAILYECVTGEPAFGADSVVEVMTRVMDGTYAPVRRLRRDAPAWLVHVIDRALALAPGERFADGRELARALEARRAPPSRRGLLAGLALVAVAVTGVAVVALRPGSEAPGAPPVPPPPHAPGPPPPPSEPPPVRRAPWATFGVSTVPYDEATMGIAFSGDGTVAVTARMDTLVRVLDPRTGKVIRDLRAHKKLVECIAISPDGKRCLSGAPDKTAVLTDLARGDTIHQLKGHGGSIRGVAFSPDGRRAITGSSDKTAKVWDLGSGTEVATLAGHEDMVIAVALSADGSLALTGSADKAARLWDVATGLPVSTLAHPETVFAVALSEDGSRAVTGSGDSVVRLFDARTGERLLELRGHDDRVTSVALSPDGRFALSRSRDSILWDLRAGRELKRFVRPKLRALALGFSRESKLIDLVTRLEPDVAQGHADRVRALAFAPSGRFLVSGGDDGDVKIHGLADRVTRAVVSHGAKVTAVEFADEMRFATGGEDGRVRLWNLVAGAATSFGRPLEASSSAVTGLALPTTTRALVATADRNVRLLDAETEKATPLGGPRDATPLLSLSGDGLRCATSGGSSVVRLYDVTKTSEVSTLRVTDATSTIALSADGRRLAAAAREKPTVHVLDVGSGAELCALAPHGESIARAVAFTPDGSRLVSLGEDGSVVVSSVARAEVLERIEPPPGDQALTLGVARDGKRIAVGTARGSIHVYELSPARR